MKVDLIQAGLIMAATWAEFILEHYPEFAVGFMWFVYVVAMTVMLNKKKKGAENE